MASIWSYRPICLLVLSIYFSTFITAQLIPKSLLKSQYKLGAAVPVSCLKRTSDGEHVTSAQTGNLQYIPFPACNETGAPLSLPYNTPGTVNCTLDALPDELYHLLEYYVHADVPLQCRVPSSPLTPSASLDDSTPKNKEEEKEAALKAQDPSSPGAGLGEPGFIPLTIALQGILQLSHLHILMDINAVMHYDGASNSIVAASAYSIPDPNADWTLKRPTPGQGTKVLRNAPLKFTFRTRWYDGLELPASSASSSSSSAAANTGMVGTTAGLFALLLLLLAAAVVGAMLGVTWEQKRGKGKWANGLLGGNKGGGNNGYAWNGPGGGYGVGPVGGYGYGGGVRGFGKRD